MTVKCSFLSKSLDLKVWWRILLASVGLFLSLEQSLADNLVKEESLLLPIEIGSKTEKLDTLVVRPVDGDKFPLVLIVNGSSGANPSEARADWLAHIAHDFAHRGWIAASIVWPGYGRSTGTFVDKAGDCAKPNVANFFNTRADELAAALKTLRTRKDVDPSVTLGFGISIGGASMLDLAGRADRPLTAVVNISGGLYHYTKVDVPEANCSLFQADLVRNFTRFGRNNPTPTLWFYAANDPFFGPDLAQRLLAGYRSGGGNVDFAGLPPFEQNGHTLFKWSANALLEPRIDDFLRRNRLPAMSQDELAPLLAALNPADRSATEVYLKEVTEKALAVPDGASGLYWHYGVRSMEDARQQALASCEKESGKTCHIVAENAHLADGWRGMISNAK